MNSDQESTVIKSSTLNDEVIVDSICRNMYAQYLRYGTTHTGSYNALPDVNLVRSGRPVFNYILGANFEPEQARNRVPEVTEMVRGWHVNTLWQIGPEAILADVSDLASECGWLPISPCTGMAIKLDEPVPDVLLPDGLTISAVNDKESLRTWVEIYFSAAPDEYKEAVFDIIRELGYGSHLPWTYYNGYISGKAVTSGMIFIEAGVAGLYYIGTLPDYRKQGIGTAMTNYLLKQAQAQGHNLIVLQATDMGANIYRRLGFEEYCSIRMLLLKAQI